MKGILSLFLSMFFACALNAQGQAGLPDLTAALQGKTVELKVKWTLSSSKGRNSGTSQIKFRDGKYSVTSSGVKLYCDGTTLWTVDPSAKEVVIGPAPEVDLNRPETLLPLCGLDPQKSKIEVRYDADGNISGMNAVLKDGTVAAIEKTGLKLSDEYSQAWFSYDTSGLGSAWVVTDLR